MNGISTTELPKRALLTPGEVAAFFRVSVKTIYNWREQGIITGIALTGGTLRFPRSAVIHFIQNGSSS